MFACPQRQACRHENNIAVRRFSGFRLKIGDPKSAANRDRFFLNNRFYPIRAGSVQIADFTSELLFQYGGFGAGNVVNLKPDPFATTELSDNQPRGAQPQQAFLPAVDPLFVADFSPSQRTLRDGFHVVCSSQPAPGVKYVSI